MLENQQNNTDEIDLFDLAASLWAQKWLIVTVTIFFTIIGIAYALLVTPIYQAKAVVIQPSMAAIQGYNEGRREAKLSEFDVKDIYDVFLTHLTSQSLKNDFFENEYLPYLGEKAEESTEDGLHKKFNEVLTVKAEDIKKDKYKYDVIVNLEDPELASKWANEYVAKAIMGAKKELEQNILSERRTRMNYVKAQLDSLLKKAKAEREDEVVRLKEALQVAKEIGLENPLLPSGKSTQEGADYVDRNLTYMRGAKAISAQLKALESRTDDEPFIPDYRDLSSLYNLLDAISIDNDTVDVARVDEKARVPDTPTKPKKKLIVLVALLLGGFVGVFAALLRGAIRDRRLAVAQENS